MKKSLLLIFIILFTNTLQSQTSIPDLGEVFKNDVVPRIDIITTQSTLTLLFDPANAYSYTEYYADFIFNNGNIIDTVYNIGFRIRGNTSRVSAKKSFKISFNTFEPGRKYNGLEKMNLNGEHNDPSITRSVLCWNILRKIGISAPRANHVELYINGDYYGLYVNIEHIDENFIENRFGNNDGNLYKCYYGVDFDYISDNGDSYKFQSNGRRTYQLKTNTDIDDYSDLAEFIGILNNTSLANLPCELESIFNVDAYLKVIAFDILTANWDGPIWNKNNCYIYKNTATGKFEYIPYDLDNTLGVSWFSWINWGTHDIYNWSQDNRPIYERILDIPEYRDRFSHYMNEIIQDYWTSTVQFSEIDQIKSMIDQSVSNDTYRTLDYGFTMQDYHNSFFQPIGMHLSYGIKDYIVAREQSALSQLVLNDITPYLSDFNNVVSIDNQTINIKIKVTDNQNNLTVKGWFSESGGSYNGITLFDDGNHDDEQANDGIYGGIYDINQVSGTIDYYITALDNQNQTGRFPRCNDLNLNYNPTTPGLVINELMASNDGTLADENDEYDDWIEIYNASDSDIDLSGLHLSDNPNTPNKWTFPNTILQPDNYLLIWADNDENQGDNHANFKLSSPGETLGIYASEYDGFAPIDVVTYPEQTTDISYGRIPNGTGEFVFLDYVSPRGHNENSVVEPPGDSTEMIIYPNPFADFTTIYHTYDEPSLLVFNTLGQRVFSADEIDKTYRWQGVNNNGELLNSGVYYISLYQLTRHGWMKLDVKQILIQR